MPDFFVLTFTNQKITFFANNFLGGVYFQRTHQKKSWRYQLFKVVSNVTKPLPGLMWYIHAPKIHHGPMTVNQLKYYKNRAKQFLYQVDGGMLYWIWTQRLPLHKIFAVEPIFRLFIIKLLGVDQSCQEVGWRLCRKRSLNWLKLLSQVWKMFTFVSYSQKKLVINETITL